MHLFVCFKLLLPLKDIEKHSKSESDTSRIDRSAVRLLQHEVNSRLAK